MEDWLRAISEPAIVVIDAIALLTIALGTVQVVVAITRNLLAATPTPVLRATWLRYAHWLVAALTFQLAADIIETSISTDWANIGRLGAVAAIRTFIDYFLDRDVDGARALPH